MADPTDIDQQPTSKRPALVTYEKVMELGSKLDLVVQRLDGLSHLPASLASLDRRLTVQETSVSAGTLMKLQDRLHALELSDARQSQSGATWEKALTWINTAVLLVITLAGFYLALRH